MVEADSSLKVLVKGVQGTLLGMRYLEGQTMNA